MSFNLIAEFKNREINLALLASVTESKGPSGYDSYLHLTSNLITVPHIDIFQADSSENIVLSGTTKNLDIQLLATGKKLDSINQYFLENKTRDNLQYLIYDNGNLSSQNSFIPLIPGLLYSTNGVVLGYLHSYIADRHGDVELEIPYTDDINDYEIIGTDDYSKSDNIITIHGVFSNLNITLKKGDELVGFSVYENQCREATNIVENCKVKIVNNHGDYLIASGKAENLNSLLHKFSELIMIDNKYYCKEFMSLGLFSFGELVKNIGTCIYKVPAALVPVNTDRVFMTDVIGLSTNKIN